MIAVGFEKPQEGRRSARQGSPLLIKKEHITPSPVGNGGEVFIAVQKNGTEIIQLGHRYALSARFSPFSQVITGVYERVHHHVR